MLAPDPRFEQIDAMDGRDFETAVAELLEMLGYEDVERTPFFDKGADILATHDGVRVAVQVKRWSSAVNVDAVRQLVDGIRQYGCDRGLLVTSSYLTGPAERTAKTWDIEIWDRKMLGDYLDGEPSVVDTSVCAHCGGSVPSGVTNWCLSHPGRYGGLVYCRTHQRRASRATS